MQQISLKLGLFQKSISEFYMYFSKQHLHWAQNKASSWGQSFLIHVEEQLIYHCLCNCKGEQCFFKYKNVELAADAHSTALASAEWLRLVCHALESWQDNENVLFFAIFSQWILGFQQQHHWTTAITVSLEAKHVCASGGKSCSGYTHQRWAWFLAHHNRCVPNAHKLFNGSGRTAPGRLFCRVPFSRVWVCTPNLLSRWILTKWLNFL